MTAEKRISARRGKFVDLDVDFYHGGVLTDPFAIRKVEIYKEQVLPHNLLEVILLPAPSTTTTSITTGGPLYPLPLVRTDVGKYVLPWSVPLDLPVPDVFQDVWYYYEDDPCLILGTGGTSPISGTGPCDIDDVLFAPLLLASCHRFWAYPDEWWTDDKLQSVNFGFEPLSQKFNSPESRYLEVGMMPLPLYDFNYNLVAPMIPYIRATITVTTKFNELMVDNEEMTIGLRQGSFRTNPFVLKWRLDTNRFLIGAYRYRVAIMMPNGVIQVSPWFIFSVN